MRIGYLIIARLKSTRLPKKVLLSVNEKPFLQHMIDRIKLSKRTNTIVLCTSTLMEDDPLEEFAKNSGIECFRGDPDDVIKRLYDASVEHKLDYILTITADCPLVDPVYADQVVEAFEKTNADLIMALDLPHGAFTHGIKPSALEKILEIKDSSDTEVWARYFWDTGLFETYHMPIINLKHKRPDIRMTLDYPEDYEFFKAVFAGLYQQGHLFTLDEIIDFLNTHPEIMELNKKCASLYQTRYTKQSEIKLKQLFTPQRVVVFGSGSIGQRHMRNLKKLGFSNIAAFRTKLGFQQALPLELGVKEITDWQEVLDFKPDVAVIANPTSLHLDAARRIAPHVKGLFIEKPLSHSQQGVGDFIKSVSSRRIVTFVAYNMLLHPIVKAIRVEKDKGHLGKPLSFQCQVGFWLPDWHPYEDFKKSYYARKDLGGGVTRTLIHEINLAHQLCGPAQRVAAFFPHSEKLNLDVETVADIMIHHRNNVVSQIHLDYIQSPMSRSGSIAFEHGLIRYDFLQGFVTLQRDPKQPLEILWEEKGYDSDGMYQEELKLFMRFVGEGRLKHEFDLWHAAHDINIVDGVFESVDTGRIVEIAYDER